jgi:hypothetical protein
MTDTYFLAATAKELTRRTEKGKKGEEGEGKDREGKDRYQEDDGQNQTLQQKDYEHASTQLRGSSVCRH